jgi:ribosomal protein S16
MLTIRLQRAGKKNNAQYRVVLADKSAAAQKKFTEVLGSYNPHTKDLQIRDQARLTYWVDDQHVEVSPTVHNLLVAKEIIKGDKMKAFTIPKKEVVAEETPAETPAIEETPTEVPAPDTATPETPVEPTAEDTTEASTETATEANADEAAPAPVAEAETPKEVQANI